MGNATNVPGTFDWEADEQRHVALRAAEPLASLLAEQLLVLHRLERSLETLLTLSTRQVNALEELAREIEDPEIDDTPARGPLESKSVPMEWGTP